MTPDGLIFTYIEENSHSKTANVKLRRRTEVKRKVSEPLWVRTEVVCSLKAASTHPSVGHGTKQHYQHHFFLLFILVGCSGCPKQMLLHFTGLGALTIVKL